MHVIVSRYADSLVLLNKMLFHKWRKCDKRRSERCVMP